MESLSRRNRLKRCTLSVVRDFIPLDRHSPVASEEGGVPPDPTAMGSWRTVLLYVYTNTTVEAANATERGLVARLQAGCTRCSRRGSSHAERGPRSAHAHTSERDDTSGSLRRGGQRACGRRFLEGRSARVRSAFRDGWQRDDRRPGPDVNARPRSWSVGALFCPPDG